MSELPEKQIKRLRTLIQEAETNLAAAKELLISIIGDDGQGAAVIREREHGTIEHLLVMPVDANEIVMAKILANGLIILVSSLRDRKSVV